MALNPGNHHEYKGTPYPVPPSLLCRTHALMLIRLLLFFLQFGMDPIWQVADNKIEFLNSYKMKISLIFGLIHMLFGLVLSLCNKIIRRARHEILLEFVPQLVFLMFIFFYLVFMIFYKWAKYYADDNEVGCLPNTWCVDAYSFYSSQPNNIYSEHCAPNLLITFINMMLFKEDAGDEDLQKVCQGKQVCRTSRIMPQKSILGDAFFPQVYMYPGQKGIQMALVVIGVLMIPIMLFGIPVHTLMGKC